MRDRFIPVRRRNGSAGGGPTILAPIHVEETTATSHGGELSIVRGEARLHHNALMRAELLGKRGSDDSILLTKGIPPPSIVMIGPFSSGPFSSRFPVSTVNPRLIEFACLMEPR